MEIIEKICCLIIWPLHWILPINSVPEIAMAMIFFIIYIMVEFIVMVMNVFSAYTGFSHFMVGLTLMVWGSDNMEMLNLAVALSKGEEEIGLIAVLSC
jgi:Ca2+/Na+ antiporter